jgi:hypothetical protein
MGQGETVSIAETVTMGTGFAPNNIHWSDAVGLTDTPTIFFPRLIVLPLDLVTIAETVTMNMPGSIRYFSVSDVVGLTDTPLGAASPNLFVTTDTVVCVETLTLLRAVTAVPITPYVLEEIGTRETHLADPAPSFQGEGESVGVTDTVTVEWVLRSLQPFVVETSGLTDTVTMSITESTATLFPVVSDGLWTNDTPSGGKGSTAVSGVIDAVGLTDTVTALVASGPVALSVSQTDSVGLTDTIPLIYPAPDIWTFGERMVVRDAVFVMMRSYQYDIDLVGFSETLTLRITTLHPFAEDKIGIFESLIPYIKEETSQPLIVIPATEILSVTEIVTPRIPWSYASVEDSVGLVEVAFIGGLHVYQSASDDVSLTESVSVVLAGLRVSTTDTISTTDIVTILQASLSVVARDTVTLIETVTVGTFDLRPTVSDIVSITEPYIFGDEQPSVSSVSTFVGPWFLYAHIL